MSQPKHFDHKKVAHPKLKVTLLLKCLVASCVTTNSVGAESTAPFITSTSATCGCDEIAALQEELQAMKVAHAAEKQAIRGCARGARGAGVRGSRVHRTRYT